MDRLNDYHGFSLYRGFDDDYERNHHNAQSLCIDGHALQDVDQSDCIFREQTTITRRAIVRAQTTTGRYHEAANNLEAFTLAKACARIDFDMYEKGQTYEEKIDHLLVGDPSRLPQTHFTDDQIEVAILRALRSRRIAAAQRYTIDRIEIKGFLYLNHIQENKVIFIVDTLREKGLIELSKIEQLGLADGAFFIKANGLDYLKQLEENDARIRSTYSEKVSSHLDSRAMKKWDLFIAHASEDKVEIARPLAHALQAKGLKIWYDEFSLKLGDSLNRSINAGLADSRYGIVILSPNFFEKEWPQKELDGLVAREVTGEKIILPVWHHVDAEYIRRFSPILADRIGISTEAGLNAVVEKILDALQG